MKIQKLLRENTSLKLNVANLSVDDIIRLLHETGYNDKETDKILRDADDANYFKYSGYVSTSHSHTYDCGYFDEDQECWSIFRLFVYISRDGTLECEYGGMPIKEFPGDEEDAEKEVEKYFRMLKP